MFVLVSIAISRALEDCSIFEIAVSKAFFLIHLVVNFVAFYQKYFDTYGSKTLFITLMCMFPVDLFFLICAFDFEFLVSNLLIERNVP